MTELSPQAQAVLYAAHDGANEVIFDIGNDSPVPKCAAAALRAAADQIPLQPLTRDPSDPFEQGLRQGQELSRAEILAIAAELEGDNEPTFTPEEVEMIQAPWSYLQSQQELEGGR